MSLFTTKFVRWALIASKVICQSVGGKLICVDLLPMEPIPNVVFVQGDFNSPMVSESILQSLSGTKADTIFSDMLHNTTGNKTLDQLKSARIVEDVMDFCTKFLKPKGSLLCKYYRGCEDSEIMALSRSLFRTVQMVKPQASRSESAEIYILGRGFQDF